MDEPDVACGCGCDECVCGTPEWMLLELMIQEERLSKVNDFELNWGVMRPLFFYETQHLWLPGKSGYDYFI